MLRFWRLLIIVTFLVYSNLVLAGGMPKAETSDEESDSSQTK